MTTPAERSINPGEALKRSMMDLIQHQDFANGIAETAAYMSAYYYFFPNPPRMYFSPDYREPRTEDCAAIAQMATLGFRGMKGHWMRRINDTVDINVHNDHGLTDHPINIAITKLDSKDNSYFPYVVRYSIQRPNRRTSVTLQLTRGSYAPFCREAIEPDYSQAAIVFFDTPELGPGIRADESQRMIELIESSNLFRR